MYGSHAFPVAALGFAVVLGACTLPDEPVEVFDPYESQNRKVHAFNKAADRDLVRPVAVAYGSVVPPPARTGLSNVATNIDTPRQIANDVLQGNAEDATHNIFRFVINSTFGIGGIFDVAGRIGLEERWTGFGETLAVWGTEEGAYVEMPLLGPATERDAFGKIVDIVSNPLRTVINSDDAWITTTTGVADGLNTRYEFRTTIDSVLYDSADSYAQTRGTYLQNRRFELGEDEEDFLFDPYADLLGE